MPGRRRMLMTGASLLAGLALLVGVTARGQIIGGSVSLVSLPGHAGTLIASPAASPPAAASPSVTRPPLFTPIAVQDGINVVGKLTMELTDRGFIPSRFECAVNEDIAVTLRNTGTRPHSFSIDELDVDVTVGPGETATFIIESPNRLGHYAYFSNTPEDRALGMVGTMTIFI